jgi:hypothetical protein
VELRLDLDDVGRRALNGVDREAYHIDTVPDVELEVERVKRGGTCSRVELGFDRGNTQIRELHPLSPAEHVFG